MPRILPSPAWDIVFDLMFCSLVFGYLMGEAAWRKNENGYRKSKGYLARPSRLPRYRPLGSAEGG